MFSISKAHNILKSLGYRVGKETIKNYISYAEKAFFVDSVYIYSRKIKDQMMYPRKIYVADNIFITALGIRYDMGRLLENLVYLELKRKTLDNPLIGIYYWRDREGREVDFVIIKGTGVIKLIQVSWDPVEYDTKQRETRSLIKAGKEFGLREGIIVTYDYEDEEKIGSFKIRYVPIWKILLGLKNLI